MRKMSSDQTRIRDFESQAKKISHCSLHNPCIYVNILHSGPFLALFFSSLSARIARTAMQAFSSCFSMRLLVFSLLLVCCKLWQVHGADDGVARLPPMGWRSWNFYQCDISQKTMMASMDAVVSL